MKNVDRLSIQMYLWTNHYLMIHLYNIIYCIVLKSKLLRNYSLTIH